MSFWLKHPNTGRYDTMLSLAVYALGAVLLKFVFSEINLGPVMMGQLDAGVVASILTPTLGALAFKRHSDNMVIKKENSNDK